MQWPTTALFLVWDDWDGFYDHVEPPAVDIQMLWHARLRGEEPLPEDFVARIRDHYYFEIISDESFFETQPDLHKLITTYYTQSETLTPDQAPPTMTGVVVRPKVIYLPSRP